MPSADRAATVAPGFGSPLPEAAGILAKSARENFTVASRLLPRETREHLMAVYGFARLVDDLGDEAPGDRGALLDEVEAELDRVYQGTPRTPLMQDLVATVRAFDIPPEPFRRLIAANRQDQEVAEYATFEELARYCELSANPVGHLVLSVLGAATPRRMALSDAVCTGLQLVEHWQDVAEDLRRGRVYLPQEDLRRFGVARDDLAASRASPRVRRLLAFEVDRAEGLLRRGVPLAASLRGGARLAVAGFVAGGRAALEAIRRAGFDVLRATPRATGPMRARALARTLAEIRRGRWT